MTSKGHSVTIAFHLSRAKNLVHALLNVLFPPTCAVCKQAGTLLCKDCTAAMPWLEGPLCEHCGRISSGRMGICSACQQRPLPLAQVRAPLLFQEPVTKVIHKLKYNGQFGLGQPLGDLMLRGWPRWRPEPDLLIPIPLHAARQKIRGYNQATLLAQQLGQALNLPVNTTTLKRTRDTQPQVHLSAAERLSNVAGAFTAVDNHIAGQTILLIDDVYTTGATMSAAATTLLQAGAAYVSGYCLARAA